MMKKLLILLFLLSNIAFAQEKDWMTHYERSGFKETPPYAETIEYCQRLAGASGKIHYTTFGKSPQGRDLPLMIVDKDGFSDPETIKASGRAVFLIQAGIHPGESEGKDAGMMLIRDMVIHEQYPDLLENVSILFIPIFNVDGHERFGKYNRINQNGPEEMGWRTTAQNLNLNRDYVKADAPEMQHWLMMFNRWLPDFFADTHTTDGADYQYVLTYAMETMGNMDPGLTEWQKESYIKPVEKKMEEIGFPIFPYVSFRSWHDPRSGLIQRVSPPMISQGYTAIQNRPGLLIETHMLKPYKPRVESTYAILRFTLEILNRDYQKLQTLNHQADLNTALPNFREDSLAVKYHTSQQDSMMVDFEGVEYKAVKSDLTGGTWYQYSDKPKTFELPLFSKPVPSVKVKLPQAYIIPPQWNKVIKRLKLHGVKMYKLEEPTSIKVESYKFSDVKWRNSPYEGRHMVRDFEYKNITEEREYPAGSVVVDMNQRTARIIAHILEPKAQDSFIQWGFFNAIFEQKEYSETYVMEKMAREMLEENPELRKRFEQKKNEDPGFAQSQWDMLNWFYKQTPYWDEKKNVYPVGRIMEREVVEGKIR